MNRRINYQAKSPELFKGILDLGLNTKKDMDAKIVDLVNIRASQLNRCAFCLDMHVKEAKIHGERELRVYHISVWRESTLFTPKERAALELTEVLTKLTEHGFSTQAYESISAELSEKEMSDITFLIGVINFWNRLNIASPVAPGAFDKLFQLDRAGL